MAGLVTAWELSSGDWRERLESITVYQRGWRLGGKGASSRGPHDRIEEHGLHVLLGCYDATFRVLREVYGELDRSVTDPACPLRTWQDAVSPAGDVGLADQDGDSWTHFVTRFSGNADLPGEPGAEDRPLTPLDVASRAMRLLADFHRGRGRSQGPQWHLPQRLPGAPGIDVRRGAAHPGRRPDGRCGAARGHRASLPAWRTAFCSTNQTWSPLPTRSVPGATACAPSSRRTRRYAGHGSWSTWWRRASRAWWSTDSSRARGGTPSTTSTTENGSRSTARPRRHCSPRSSGACTTSPSRTRAVTTASPASRPDWVCSWPGGCSSTSRGRSSGG